MPPVRVTSQTLLEIRVPAKSQVVAAAAGVAMSSDENPTIAVVANTAVVVFIAECTILSITRPRRYIK